ncbi:MAG: hypothetical protein AAGK21_05850 [Bacteroidota bacterium]
MQFIFDNLIAFLVGTTLFVGLLYVQQQRSHAAVEATVRYQAETQSSSFVDALTKELENARTREQITAALGTTSGASTFERDANDSGNSTTERAIDLAGTAAQTDWIQFVTLADPTQANASPLLPVAYRLEPTGDQAIVNGQIRNLNQVVRYVYDGSGWVRSGGSPSTVVGFQVRALPGGVNGRIRELPGRLDVSVEMANQGQEMEASDQTSRSRSGLTRQGATVRVYASGTAGRALPSAQGIGQIPRLPWVSAYTPPPPPAPGLGSGGGGGNGGGPSGPPTGGGGTGGGGSGGSGGGGSPPVFDTSNL